MEADSCLEIVTKLNQNSNAKFYMKTDLIDQGGVKTPVLLLKDMKPFDKTDTLMVGSLTDANTSGNWSGE